MPNKIYVAVTITLVVISALVTARIVGSRGAGESSEQLASAVKMQCDSWARELDTAAEAYERHARSPNDKVGLPFGATHSERHVAGLRLMSEQKFCRFVRKRDAPDVGSAEIDQAGAAAFTSSGDDPNKLAAAIRRLADAAKRDATLEIGP